MNENNRLHLSVHCTTTCCRSMIKASLGTLLRFADTRTSSRPLLKHLVTVPRRTTRDTLEGAALDNPDRTPNLKILKVYMS